MIGYYIHHHGHGHRMRALSICSAMDTAATALSSVPLPHPSPFVDSVVLARDDEAPAPIDPTAGGALHWAPVHDEGLRRRMMQLCRWIEAARPSLMVADVSVEVAAVARLLGVPVVVMAMPGERTDSPHRLGYRLAEHIIAAWPQDAYDPVWLREFAHKTTFVGGITRFDGRHLIERGCARRPRILVLSGSGGTTVTVEDVQDCARIHHRYRWQMLGGPRARWVQDPWPALCGCDVVVSHAGQNAVADIAAARRPAIVIAQHRPYDEQRTTAGVLAAHRLAVSVPRWPPLHQWPALIAETLALGGDRWVRWQTAGAAQRAAAVIDDLAHEAETRR